MVGANDMLTSLVEDAYAAALDESLWEPWGKRLIATMGGAGGTMFVMNDDTRRIVHLQPHWSESPEEYFNHWHQHDPQTQLVSGLSGSTVYVDTDHLDFGNAATSAFMAWQRSRFGFDHHMGTVIVDRRLGMRAGFCIHRSVAAGCVPPGTAGAVARLVALHRRRDDARLSAW